MSTKRWFLHSGIQNVNKDHEIEGSFNSWFDADKNNYYYVYSEITGYGITTLVFLNRHYPEEILLERAKMAAEWTINFAMHELGGVKTREYHYEADNQENYSFDSEIIFSFDTGMVLNGMISLYNEIKDEKYLGASIKIADFLINKMQKEDGSFYATLNAKESSLGDKEDKWSNQSGSFHSKLAIGLIDLYEVTKKEEYKKSAIAICEFALKQQMLEGRFISFRDSINTHMHPNAYSAEGLIYAAVKLNIPRYMESCKKAVEWALSNQLESGGVPPIFMASENKFSNNERTDTLAQILRLGILLIRYNQISDDYLKKLEKLKDHLISFQEKEGSQKGGFRYGAEEDGTELYHINSWCSMFSVQALLLYRKYIDEKQNIDVGLLI